MTRPGKRELESIVDDLTQGHPDTPREWIEQEALRRVTESDGEVGLLSDHEGAGSRRGRGIRLDRGPRVRSPARGDTRLD